MTIGKSGLVANLLPFQFFPGPAEKGVLRAHLARANPQWQEIGQELEQEIEETTDSQHEALIVFQGTQGYISPSFYATKQETGKVVPTWNYTTVQAHGTLRFTHDKDWLLQQVTQLTNQHEANRTQPWAVDDAPDDFIQSQLRAIVGLEMTITSLEGKWKVSQNRPEQDRHGVVAGLRAQGCPVSQDMANLVEAFAPAPKNKP